MKRFGLVCALLSCMTIAAVAQVDNSVLDSIVGGQFKVKTLPKMQGLQDGERYAQLVDNRVLVYQYKTGNVVDTLFDMARLKSGRVEDIEGFALVNNERYMLVYRNRKQLFRRSFEADYYLYDRQKQLLKPLTDTLPVRQPVASPNGKYIAFVRDNNLYIHKLDFGTEVAVTTDGRAGQVLNGAADWLYEEEFGTTGEYCFSPDSKQLAFLRTDEREVTEYSWQTVLGEGMPQLESIKYPRAGGENSRVSAMVYDVQYKSVKRMQVDAEYIPRLRWTNSSEQLAVFTVNRNQNVLEMWLCNPKSTVGKRVYREENKQGWINYSDVDEWQFLQQDMMLVVSEKSGYRHAYLYSLMGQEQEALTRGDFDVTRVYGIDEATNTLFYQAATLDGKTASPQNRTVWSYQLKKKKTQPLLQTEGYHAAQLMEGRKYLVDNYSTVTKANRYTLYDATGKEVRELLNNDKVEEAFKELRLPEKQFFTFTTERGDELNGTLLVPQTTSSKKMPVLLIQYSGPESQQVLNRWRVDWEYFLAAQGIVCVTVDGRGTGARGRQFRQQTYKQIGVMEAEDQVSVARYMARQGYVDKNKIGIWGWSYGGFMTILSMSQPESPFCCGIAVAPVTDFRLYDSGYTERFMQRPESNETGYEQISLPKMADKLQGKLLIVHGLADDNVHAQNMWKYVDALVEADKQFQMQVYADDNHFLRKRNNYKHLYHTKWQFLQDTLLR